MAPKGKNTSIWLPDLDFSRALEWKGGLTNNFLRFFGVYFNPPDHQNIKKKFWGVTTIFRKWHPKPPGFGIGGTRKRVPRTRFRVPRDAWYF